MTDVIVTLIWSVYKMHMYRCMLYPINMYDYYVAVKNKKKNTKIPAYYNFYLLAILHCIHN